MIDGIPVLSPTCLIPFKVKAWLDLKERKMNGEQVDSKNIKKHKNDVFRLAQLITANTRQVLSPEIAEDMKKFLSEIADETVDLKSLGIRGTDKQKMTDMEGLPANPGINAVTNYINGLKMSFHHEKSGGTAFFRKR